MGRPPMRVASPEAPITATDWGWRRGDKFARGGVGMDDKAFPR
jgi:hypothetical protein